MKKYSFEVSDEIAAAIEFAASQEAIAVEEWLSRFMTCSLVDKDRFTTQTEFDQAARHVLDKNRELYRRLAKDP